MDEGDVKKHAADVCDERVGVGTDTQLIPTDTQLIPAGTS
jgi:hypothetical protein